MLHRFRFLSVVFLVIFPQIIVNAQREADNWVFGVTCGLTFSTGNPQPISGNVLQAISGSALVSHSKTGEILFYTDGRNFWNSRNELMINAHTLPSKCFARMTQPAIILPSTEDADLYHVFCIRPDPEDDPPPGPYDCLNATDFTNLDDSESGLALIYYLIDMRLNGGLGNVVVERSNVVIQTNITEKLTAVEHPDGMSYWVIVHGWMNSRFFAHRLSDNGLIELVTSDVGSTHGEYGGIFFRDEVEGEMKLSPDGKKIAVAVFSENRPFEMFDFDKSTGKVSNGIDLGNISGQYGVSFSPDNSKLYVSSDSRTIDREFLDIILQYDLNQDAATIAKSVRSLIVNNPKTNLPPHGVIEGWSTVEKGMALAPDGRLYITGNDPVQNINIDDILVVVDKPNELGHDANIYFKEFKFGVGKTGVGLPNFMQSYFNGIESSSVCSASSSFFLYPNPSPDRVNISALAGCNLKFKYYVINSLGQMVLQSVDEYLPHDYVDLSMLSPGMYVVVLSTPLNDKVVKKLIKL